MELTRYLGDGRADYLWVDADSGSVQVWLNTANDSGEIVWVQWVGPCPIA
jgi:hypothetical protein